MSAILQQIVSETRLRLAGGVTAARRAELEKMAAERRPRGFRKHLLEAARLGPAIIAELKKASPSRGLIREQFPVAELARQMQQAGAAALSVLTEEKHFQGSLDNMRIASESVVLPCLRKDFIIDEVQLLEARAYGADAALLIVAALSDSELRRLAHAATALGIDVLCEVHDEEELRRALEGGFDIIGVNNRDLRTFEIALETSLRLIGKIPSTALRVAESGIYTGADVTKLQTAGYDAFLVGESLMKQPSPGEGLRKLLADASHVTRREVARQ